MLLEGFLVGVDFVAISAHELEVVQLVSLLLVSVSVGEVGNASILKSISIDFLLNMYNLFKTKLGIP